MASASARLGLVPRLHEDQTISSFLLLLARHQAATPHELCALVWPEHQFWPRDIDRTATNALIQSVAQATGLTEDLIRAMTLRELVDGMGRSPTNAGIQHGILPVGVYHRLRRLHGQQFCPDCLKANPPYLRRLWRLEFVSACPIHGWRLFDACPECDAPFIPHRLDSLLERQCYRCHGSLVGGNRETANDQAMQLQRVLISFLYETPTDVAQHLFPWMNSESRFDVFDGIRRLCRLLKFSANGGDFRPCRPSLKWDFLRVCEREAVLGAVSKWLDDWPTSFIAWATTYRVSQQRLMEYGPWPDWIQGAISQLCSRPRQRARNQSPTLVGLRAEYGNTVAYRMARAKLLLDRAAPYIKY